MVRTFYEVPQPVWQGLVLAEALKEPDLAIARERVEALKRMGPQAKAGAPTLAAALSDPDIRHQAGEALRGRRRGSSGSAGCARERCAWRAANTVGAAPAGHAAAR